MTLKINLLSFIVIKEKKVLSFIVFIIKLCVIEVLIALKPKVDLDLALLLGFVLVTFSAIGNGYPKFKFLIIQTLYVRRFI